MTIVTTINDTSVGVLHRETQQFSTDSGPITLTATGRDILVTFRASAKGSMWLGAWRYVIRPVFDNIALHTDIRFSDNLCRKARDVGGDRVSPMSCYLGQAAVNPDTESVLMSRTIGAFVVEKEWLNIQLRKQRKHEKKIQGCS